MVPVGTEKLKYERVLCRAKELEGALPTNFIGYSIREKSRNP